MPSNREAQALRPQLCAQRGEADRTSNTQGPGRRRSIVYPDVGNQAVTVLVTCVARVFAAVGSRSARRPRHLPLMCLIENGPREAERVDASWNAHVDRYLDQRLPNLLAGAPIPEGARQM